VAAYILRRLLTALATLLGITVVTFAVLHLAPGQPQPGQATDSLRPDPAVLQALRDRYGLDRPLPAQYLHWVGRVARLDFGRSLVDHRPVRARILERLPRTLGLNLLALALILSLAVPLGALAARRRDGLLDRASGPALYLLYSLPSFWVALLLQGSLAVSLGLFPLAGLHSDGAPRLGTAGAPV
jgi:peptide/nickel transport system permease protein